MGTKSTIAIVALLAASTGLLLHRQHKFETAWQTERAAMEQRLAEQQKEQSKAAMEQKAVIDEAAKLQAQLITATNELVTAKLKVEAYEAKRQLELQAQAAEAKKVADLTQLKSEVPAPTITTQKSGGKEKTTYTFPKLLAPGGNPLATDAEFRTQFGRRFVFRAGNGRPVAYDVDELHPGVLLHLGLSRESAITAQEEVDRQAQIAEQKYRAQLAARAEAEKKNAELRAKMAVEYAKIAEEKRKSQQDEQLQRQAAETERMKAEAAMRGNDDIVEQALRPFYPESFIQQILTPQQSDR